MSQDPLALAGFNSAARHEAEYDAVYAAVTATERGRWFLSEYANRNRAANTDLVVAALARIEAAIGGITARSDTPAHPAIACANGHHSADVADAVPITKIIVAAERIADISFRLRESAVDASLCDDIEGVAREIYEACGPSTANVATPVAEVPSPSDEARTDIIASREQIPPAMVMTSEALDAVTPAMDDGADFQSPVASPVDETPRWHIEGPDFLFQPAAKESDQESIEPARRPELRHTLLPQTLFQPGPKDDPADLFDAAGSAVAVSAAVAPQASVEAFAQVPLQIEPPVQSPQAALRVVTSAVVRPLSRPVSNDPRGTIRDLSEEELIALVG
jgi:hypothetical protein